MATKRRRILVRTQPKTTNKWEWTGFSKKTLWDWLPSLIQLLGALAIPVAITLGTTWFSAQQNQTSLQVSERQHQADLQIAATRYANDQQLAADQQRETTLKTYLDDMSNLLLNNRLLESKSGDTVSEVARERTLTTLRRLDATRNRIIFQFLQDARLVGVKNAVIDLSNANLSGDDLEEVNLNGVDLSGANLNGADLNGADLSGDDLEEATLIRANLSYANLGCSYKLVCSNMKYVDLSYADLRHANLHFADLSGAVLEHVDLRGANMLNIILTGADLTGADLTGANASLPEISQASFLQGVIMPDGSKHP